MPQLLIPDLDDRILERLRQRAAEHARSTEVEAQEILAAALPPPAADPWAVVNALRNELAQAGREFPDSTVLAGKWVAIHGGSLGTACRAVVTGEHDQRLLAQTKLAEFGDKSADQLVHVVKGGRTPAG